MADIVDDALDLHVAERALEGRHRAFLAVLYAVDDEGVAALRARELGPFPGLAPAILVAPAASGGEEFIHLRVAHRLLFAGGEGSRPDQACGEDAHGDSLGWHRSSDSKGPGDGSPRPFQRLPAGYFRGEHVSAPPFFDMLLHRSPKAAPLSPVALPRP